MAAGRWHYEAHVMGTVLASAFGSKADIRNPFEPPEPEFRLPPKQQALRDEYVRGAIFAALSGKG
jgi:hypothetical protein